MEDNRPYVKRINLGIDTRNPDYKKAYDYIMEHKGGKFRFICDCVLQVMEGRGIQEKQQIEKVNCSDIISKLSLNPEVLQSLAQAVAQYMTSVQPQQEIVEAHILKEETVGEKQETVVKPVDFEPASAYPDEEKKEESSYDGPVLDMDMLAGIGAWDEFLE